MAENIERKALWCPECSKPHLDIGVWATTPHHTHLCHYCHHTWRIEPYVFGRDLTDQHDNHYAWASGFESGCRYSADSIATAQVWRPILEHNGNTEECMLGVFYDGCLSVACPGAWEPGEVTEEWDEVEDGVKVKLWEDQEEGRWLSEYIEEPTHFKPIAPPVTDGGRI